MHIEPGTTNVTISIYCRDADGDELTGKTAADFTLTYHRPGTAPVAITLSDLATLSASHTDGGIKEIGNGEYRLDVPDAAFAAGVTQVSIQGSVDGGYVIGYPIDLYSTAGSGPFACTWTVNDGSTSLEGAEVAFYMSGMLTGRGTTDASGEVQMSLGSGTHTVAITLAGYTFANTTHVVSATSGTWTNTFSMTAVTISAPADAGTATGRLDLHTKHTTAEMYQSIYVRQTARRTATGHGDSKEWRELVSDAAGIIEAPFWKSQTYEAKRGRDGTPVAFTVGTDDTFYLPSVLGEP